MGDRAELKLVFPLPPTVMVAPGRHQPCLHGCTLFVDRQGFVVIGGRLREQLFAQATRFLKAVMISRPPTVITATLLTSGPGGGRDSWSIVVNADVAFSPSKLPVEIIPQEAA